VREGVLGQNAAWRLLEPSWGTARLDTPVALDRDGTLEARLFPVAPKIPPFLRDVMKPHAETTVGLRVTERSSGARLVFVPGLKSLDSASMAELAAADVRFVDGTFFTADELRTLRPGAPDAVAMGHNPITGPESSLATHAELPGRTYYNHKNNTNPVLDAKSPERARVERSGVRIAADGMEIDL
jgi:pyrroloquinoline quinone biosynthesis protein B